MVFVVRKSFATKFAAIPEAFENLNNDESKSILTTAYLEYRRFRNLIGCWMTLTLSVGVLGLTAQTPYIYDLYKSEIDPRVKDMVTVYSIMIWSEKIMFIAQPIVILGGINFDYLWKDLRKHVTKQLTAASW